MKYEVVVGNLGSVHAGSNGRTARQIFVDYCNASVKGWGRAAGESVTLFRDDEIVEEYIGTQSRNGQ